jgi:putative MATE family efflux protein
MEKLKKHKKLTLFALTWPIFIEILLHILMGNADTLMLSQYSDNAVAAVGVSNQLLMMVVVMFGFVAAGTSILIAQNLGAKRSQEASEIAMTSLTLNLLFGLFLSGLLVVFGARFLTLMDLPQELMDDALVYLRIIGGFVFIQALIMTLSAVIRSHGFTKDAMYVTMGMNIINVIGNYLFIFGPMNIPVLGVEGVAISTVASRCIGLVAFFVILKKRVKDPTPLAYFISFPMNHIKNLLKIGVPTAGEHLAYNSSQVYITYFVAILGTTALTAKIYTSNLMFLILAFSFAIGQGTQILIGHQIGAGENDKAYRLCMRSLKIGMLISTVTAVVFAVFAKPLLSIFTDNADILSLGTILLVITIILEPGRVFNMVVNNSLRAAGDVRVPVYISIAVMWCMGVPLAYILGIYLELGLIGIWIAFVADEWVRGLFMLWRWRSRVWQRINLVNAPAKEKLTV